MRTRSRRVVGLLAAALAAAALAASPPDHAQNPDSPPGHDQRPEQPQDFIALSDSLSQPEFPETVRESFSVPMHDGEELYVEVVRPDPEVYGEQPFPVIMEASPYHGTVADRSGTRIFPDPLDAEGNKIGLTGYFAPRGYAVAIVDLRGTGKSGGCLDHLGPNDAKDLKTIVEWAASQDWSTGKVGMTGHSYVGSTPSVAAAQNPEGLATIVPSAGLASMYDHQFQRGVPYNLQYIGPMVAYEALAMDSELPPGTPSALGEGTGDDFGQNNEDTGCGWKNSSLTAGSGQVTGQYELWHAQRDHRVGATEADIPVFMIHGVNDNAARIPAAEWFFGARFDRSQDKVWIGQWDHGSTNGRCGNRVDALVLHPTCRFDQFQYALHAWFDKHLKGMDVDTGPSVEAFLNPAEPVDITVPKDPADWQGQVFTDDAWHRPSQALELFADASDLSLSTTPPAEDGTATFTAASALLAGPETLEPISGSEGPGTLEFTSEPLTEDIVAVGVPKMEIDLSTNAQLNQLVMTLYREHPDPENDGEWLRSPANTCAMNPLLRFGVKHVAPVTPGEIMTLHPQCFAMAHHFRAGDRLVLEVGVEGPHHAELALDPQITVHTGPDRGAHRMPVVSGARLHDDVPLREIDRPVGPAQPPVEGEVTTAAPGAGVRTPATSSFFEFDVLEGFDNAIVSVTATPAEGGDLDLYLQRQLEDGSWSEDLASGESGSTTEETMAAERLKPGRYRVEVHNWAAPPGAPVALLIEFVNQEGVSGDASGAS